MILQSMSVVGDSEGMTISFRILAPNQDDRDNPLSLSDLLRLVDGAKDEPDGSPASSHSVHLTVRARMDGAPTYQAVVQPGLVSVATIEWQTFNSDGIPVPVHLPLEFTARVVPGEG